MNPSSYIQINQVNGEVKIKLETEKYIAKQNGNFQEKMGYNSSKIIVDFLHV